MTHSHPPGNSQEPLDICLADAGIGENFLALEGLELDIPARTVSQDEPTTTLWDDYFEEDIASLAKHADMYQ